MLARLCRHLHAAYWRAPRLLPPRSLQALAAAVEAAEHGHDGEICIVVEAALTPMQLLTGLAARDRALQVFAESRIWDTERNTGVLVYLLLGDHAVEIISDRGLGMIDRAAWDEVAARFGQAFRTADPGSGCTEAIASLGELLRRHLPAAGPTPDELSNPVRVL